MEVKDWITLAGFVLSFVLGLIGAVPQFQKTKTQTLRDNIESENAAFELAEKYEKKVTELQKRVDHMEEMLEGTLHLHLRIPLGDVFKNGSATIDGVVAEIVKQKG